MKKNLIKVISLMLVVIFAMSACSIASGGAQTTTQTTPAIAQTTASQGTPAAKSVKLVAGHVLADGSHFDVGMDKFAELADKYTGGTVNIEVKPGGVLGQEVEMISALQQGTLDVAMVSTAPVGGFLPEMMVFDLPYLFVSNKQAWAACDGEAGAKVFADLQKIGIVGLSYLENGFRSVIAKKVISAPEDLAGVKIRVMENKVHTTSFKKLNAIVVPMASGEVYTGLQQGTIDAAENSVCGIYSNKYYEAAKEYSLTKHFYGAVPLLISKKTWDKLSKDQQDGVMKAAAEARDYQREQVAVMEKDLLAKMVADGLHVHEVDPAPYQKIFATVYDEFTDTIPKDLIVACQNAKA